MGRTRVLTVWKDFCTGCAACEIVCSLQHSGRVNPALARLKLAHSSKDHAVFPIVCRHCRNAPCKAVCPVPEAMQEDASTGAIAIDDAACIRCLACADACPFAAIQVGPDKEVLKCDLCGGSPVCVEYCPPVGHLYPGMPRPAQSCLQYVEPTRLNSNKRRKTAGEA